MRSAENTADCANRGLSAAELLDHPLWCQGPMCLRVATQVPDNNCGMAFLSGLVTGSTGGKAFPLLIALSTSWSSRSWGDSANFGVYSVSWLGYGVGFLRDGIFLAAPSLTL